MSDLDLDAKIHAESSAELRRDSVGELQVSLHVSVAVHLLLAKLGHQLLLCTGLVLRVLQHTKGRQPLVQGTGKFSF